MGPIVINPSDLIILGTLSAIGVIAGISLFLVFKFSPAKIFLKAWLSGSTVGFVNHRHGIGEFVLGKIKDKGFVDFKGIGSVMMTENSHSLEKKSKRPIFNVFSEFASTIPKQFYAFIEELKSAGFPIRNNDQYKQAIKFVNDPEAEKNIRNSKIPEKEKESILKKINQLRNEGISIKPWKTYNVTELADLFPYNINPGLINLKVDEATNRARKQDKHKQTMLITGAIAFFIVVIGAVIAMKFIGGTNPEVTVHLAQNGVEAVNQTIQNATASAATSGGPSMPNLPI